MNRMFLLLPAAAVALMWLSIGRKSSNAINPESGAKRPPSIGINPADFEISDTQYSNIKADCTNWTAKQFATFARLRKTLDAENWPDHRLARRISRDDLDNPDYLNAMLASDKAAKGKYRYALPREKGLHYAQTQNTPLAYIMAAYANGADKKERVFDPTLIEQAIAAYGELPELLYAKNHTINSKVN